MKRKHDHPPAYPSPAYGPTKLVVLLCILAGARVLIFSAAFPFCNGVDEHAHCALILKYAAGHIPRGLEYYSKEFIRTDIMFFSPEYYCAPGELPADLERPLWTFPKETIAASMRKVDKLMVLKTNHESTQFPIYYLTAGAWYNIGKALGLRGGVLLYWLRFLNVPIYMALIWIAYLMTKKLYPANHWLILGVPAMLAFFPQDVFYSLNNDVLSALLAALSLYLLVTYYKESRSTFFCILTGLSVAGAFLTKSTNIPLLAFFGIILSAKIAGPRQKGGPGLHIPGLVSIMLAAAVPISAWLIRNQLVLGDITGNHAKIMYLGWTRKPLGQLLHHPIFTPGGAAYFWNNLMTAFWQGEIGWHRVRMSSETADAMYVLTSSAFLLAAAILAWKRKEERFAGGVNFLMLGLSVAFLAGLSMIYDFHECANPSRQYPYFTSGRLILGALVPFLMLYLAGLGAILDYLRMGRLRWVVLSLILAVMLGSEISITRGVFASAFNLYHLFGS